ncbi:DUF3237 domain-containing protein [Novosphingobium sp. JCM 18896]|uniref:DUF3237 domain-containing protein n=1 Tax=Novosphingobium sp. JCM 18896 TaxID=2989731 RepID=UPI002221A665|nr:DUF3237 domain-containing protein [Novosphingobium sp. JCM 18896]MCW1428325.1 DUF3237 domain-containing protein [Novosphingobium sp. JCM 18896]
MLELVPLGTAVVQVAPPLAVGAGPAGNRSIGELRSAEFAGERLRASLAGAAAADWMAVNGTIGEIDVRMTLRTHDDALVYVRYGGRLNLADRANGLHAYVAPVFETGDERYAWLNAVQAVGKGKLIPGPDGTRIEYEFYEVR